MTNSYLSAANRFVQNKWILDFPDFCGQQFFWPKDLLDPKDNFWEWFQPIEEKNNHKRPEFGIKSWH